MDFITANIAWIGPLVVAALAAAAFFAKKSKNTVDDAAVAALSGFVSKAVSDAAAAKAITDESDNQ